MKIPFQQLQKHHKSIALEVVFDDASRHHLIQQRKSRTNPGSRGTDQQHKASI